MQNNELVSIIIPTYNRKKLIIKSIKSVLNQTYKNIEIIVVDDGSTDNTKESILKLQDKRIKYYFYKNNKGACYARNYGLKKASGAYIAFQDSDDIFYKEKIEKQLYNIKKNKADLDFCKIRVNPGEYIIPDLKTISLFSKNGIHNTLCEYGNFISTQAILMKKDLFLSEKFDNNLLRLQDYDLVLRVSHKYKISFTNELLVDLFHQKDSISNSIEKLHFSTLHMILKQYNFSNKNLDKLHNYLLSLYSASCKYPIEQALSSKNYEIIEKDNIIIQLQNNIGSYKNNEEKYQIEKENYIKKEEELNNKIYSLKQELETKKSEIILLSSELNSVYNSKSWKITKPLRKIINSIKKVK